MRVISHMPHHIYPHCSLSSGGCCSNLTSVTILFHIGTMYTVYAVIEYFFKFITNLVHCYQRTYFNIYSHKTRLHLHKTRLRNTHRSDHPQNGQWLLRDKSYVLAYEHGKSILLASDALCGYKIWVENYLTSVNINMNSMLYLEPSNAVLQTRAGSLCC